MNHEEIEQNRFLQFFGAALALTHIASLISWIWEPNNFARRILSDSSAICWPFWDSCAQLRPFSDAAISSVLLSLAVVAMAAIFVLILGRVCLGWWLSLGAFVLKLLIVAQDYRFQGNFHYMSQLVIAAWLFVPNRRYLLPRLLVLFYVGAGVLKFNLEWLEGRSFIRDPWISGFWLKVACAYVVLLEVVFAPFLLSAKRCLRYVVFAQVLLFHAFSWHVVGFLYPTTMFLLLSYFPFVWLMDKRPYQKKNSAWPARVFIAAFVLAQLVPWSIPGDSALTGQGRIFALNMLDARAQCRHYLFVRSETGSVEASDYNLDWGLRIGCDPLLLYRYAENICRQAKKEIPGFIDLDWGLFSRRSSDSSLGVRVRLLDFCAQKPGYSSWRKNDWIESIENPDAESFVVGRTLKSESAPSPLKDFSVDSLNASQGQQPLLAPLMSPDGRLFVGTDVGWLKAYSQDGSELWRTWFNETLTGIAQMPVLAETLLIVAAANGRLYALDSTSGHVQWAQSVGVRFLKRPQLSSGRVSVVWSDLQERRYESVFDSATGRLLETRLAPDLSGDPPVSLLSPERELIFEDGGSRLRNRWKRPSAY